MLKLLQFNLCKTYTQLFFLRHSRSTVCFFFVFNRREFIDWYRKWTNAAWQEWTE